MEMLWSSICVGVGGMVILLGWILAMSYLAGYMELLRKHDEQKK